MPRHYVRGYYRRSRRRSSGGLFGVAVIPFLLFVFVALVARYPAQFAFIFLLVCSPVVGLIVLKVVRSKKRKAAQLAAQQLTHQQLMLAQQQRQGRDTRYIPKGVRQEVWNRCGGRCVDCGSTFYLEFDHIIPLAKGGATSANNLQLLCRNCNQRKAHTI